MEFDPLRESSRTSETDARATDARDAGASASGAHAKPEARATGEREADAAPPSILAALDARTRRILWAAAGALVCAFAFALFTAGEDEAPSAAPARALPVETFRARVSNAYTVRELYAGRIVSRRASDLGFERPGRIVEVLHDEGARVREGAVLARLDTRELLGKQRELLAQLGAMDAQLDLARATAERQRQLFEAGHLSSQRFDESVYSERRLEARREAAAAALEQIEVQLELSELRAPFDGVLAQRFADEGAVLPGGAPVLRLLEDGVLELHLGVPPELAARLAPGSTHEVELASAPRDAAQPDDAAPRARATLHAILPTVASDTRTVTAVLRITDTPAEARHGALARVAFSNRIASTGFWLPLAALAEGKRGLWTAYVAQPDDAGVFRAEQRQLEVVHAEADRAFVRGTLRAGDRVVTGGVHRLAPGIRVTPVAAPAPPDAPDAPQHETTPQPPRSAQPTDASPAAPQHATSPQAPQQNEAPADALGARDDATAEPPPADASGARDDATATLLERAAARTRALRESPDSARP